MRGVLPFLFIAMIWLGGSQSAFACVCGGAPDKWSEKQIKAAIAKEFNESASVFSGEVGPLDTFTVKFRLITMWTGEAFEEFTISTGAKKLSEDYYRSSSCDYRLSTGILSVNYFRPTTTERLSLPKKSPPASLMSSDF